MWAAPVHVYGTIYGTEGEAMIDCCIKKSASTKCTAVFGFIMLSIPLGFIQLWIWNFGMDGIIILFTLLFLLSLIIASLYIPKSGDSLEVIVAGEICESIYMEDYRSFCKCHNIIWMVFQVFDKKRAAFKNV